MGRKSKLTEKQWQNIKDRLVKGESAAALAREYGVAPSTIRERFSDAVTKIKTVANQIVEVENNLKSLPISAQISALNLADDLRAISMHLAGAAKLGAATAHRLFGIAHEKVQFVDDATPLESESIESLKGIAILTRMGNDSAKLGIDLLSANKDTIKRLSEEDSPQVFEPVEVVIVDARRGQ